MAEHFDAAIRIGELEDSRLVTTRLCEHRRILCAAPAYLQRHGTPQVPADLAAHNCLGFTGLRSYPEWRLTRDGVTEAVQIRGTLISNDNEALLAAARLGLGIRRRPIGWWAPTLLPATWCRCWSPGGSTRKRAST